MALVHADRVKEESTTTGTGTYNLDGAVADFQTFVAGIGSGNTCYYTAFEAGAGWEVGLGTVTDAAPDTLARTTILASSNAGAAVSWAAGTREIWVGIPAGKFLGSDEVLAQGRTTHVIPASEWHPTITNGAGRSYEELATNDLISDTLDFDTTTQEFATAMWCPPKKYNGGTVTFRVKHRLPGAASTETVDYALSGVFIRDDDAVDAAPGTAVVVTDTFIAAGDLHVSPESAAVTFGGTYAAGCKVMLKLQRNVAGDNAAGDAKVEAVELFWTSNASTDT